MSDRRKATIAVFTIVFQKFTSLKVCKIVPHQITDPIRPSYFLDYSSRNEYDWNAHNRQVVLDGTRTLERTGESIARSHQIAIETENVGTEVVTELGEQREALLRTRGRLEDANSQLDNAKSILSRMGRNVLYNKLILILIIVLEALILAALTYLKFFKRKAT